MANPEIFYIKAKPKTTNILYLPKNGNKMDKDTINQLINIVKSQQLVKDLQKGQCLVIVVTPVMCLSIYLCISVVVFVEYCLYIIHREITE